MEYDIEDSKAAFAALSAASFSKIPTWLVTQQKMISLVFKFLCANPRLSLWYGQEKLNIDKIVKPFVFT